MLLIRKREKKNQILSYYVVWPASVTPLQSKLCIYVLVIYFLVILDSDKPKMLHKEKKREENFKIQNNQTFRMFFD